MKVSVQQQKKQFELHLQQQQMSREAKLELKKLEEMQKKNPEEHMLYIQKEFKNKSEEMDAAIKKYKQKQVSFDSLMTEYRKTKQYYVNMSYALKTYDRQSYKQQLDKMYNTIIDLKKKFEPRKKFKFSRRQQDFGVKSQVDVEKVAIKETQFDNIPGIQQKINETIQVNEQHQKLSSYKVINCKQSSIEILHKTQILFLKNLEKCTVRVALTKSTVFVDNCNNCTLEINCHQLRIHNSTNTTFKIFVTSKAIIEDCNQVIFTPYGFQYQNKEKDQIQFERKGKQNLWRQIQDFNWLKQNIKSPHYQLIQS